MGNGASGARDAGGRISRARNLRGSRGDAQALLRLHPKRCERFATT
jgi:hypothetical protein